MNATLLVSTNDTQEFVGCMGRRVNFDRAQISKSRSSKTERKAATPREKVNKRELSLHSSLLT